MLSINSVYRKGLLFFVVFIGLWVGLDQVLLLGLRNIDTGSFGVWNKAMEGRINARILISGSSRARGHYDPVIIGRGLGKSCFNVGRDGTLTDLQLAFLRAYLRHNQKPELIIQNLDLTSFTKSRDIFTPGQYLPYLGEPDIYQALAEVKPSIWKAKYIPLYGFNDDDMQFTPIQAMLGLLSVSTREDRTLGFHPMNRSWNRDFERFKMTHPTGMESRCDPAAVEVLNQLIDLCKSLNIELVFVYSPEYYENHSMIVNRQVIFEMFENLAARYQVPFYDYSNTSISQEKNYFYNSQHLNTEGARLFSIDLTEKLRAAGFAASRTN
jgi:hypothetical protein